MTIEHYSFGHIRVDGKEYTSDLIIYPERIDDAWWRNEGHRLELGDLPEVLDSPPQSLIIGTGYSGCMAVPEATLEALQAAGIEVLTVRTSEAVKLYNRLRDKKRQVVAALHLTC